MEVRIERDRIDTGDNLTVVKLTGSATIRDAEELRNALLAALKESPDVILDVRDVTDHDFSFLQLVWSAYQHACTSGRRFHFGGSCPANLEDSFTVAGYPLYPDLAG